MKLFKNLLVITCCLGLSACSPSDNDAREVSNEMTSAAELSEAEGSLSTVAEGSSSTTANGSLSTAAKGSLGAASGDENSTSVTQEIVVTDTSEASTTSDSKRPEVFEQPASETAIERPLVADTDDESASSESFNSRVEPPLKTQEEPKVLPEAIIEKTKPVAAPKVAKPDEVASTAISEPEAEAQATVAKAPSLPEPISGTWIKKTQKINGLWTIEHRSDGAYLVLGDDFKTRKAPDLKFVLSGHSAQQANNKNALQGSQLVSLLKSAKGAQEYKLPDDYGSYKALLLHCEKYTKLWGAADLAGAK